MVTLLSRRYNQMGIPKYKQMFFYKTDAAKKIILMFFVVWVASNLMNIRPGTAEAQLGPMVPTGDILNQPAISIIAANETAQTNKEFTLDAIAVQAAKIVISNITSSIVTWINSGFEGGPAFVTNPSQFLTDISDQIAGNFIAGTELGFLCEPFSLDVRLALNLGYSSTFVDRNFCRLSDVISNTENFTKFTNGDFSQGGWDSWFEITQNPQNNPLGAYLAAQEELALRTARGQSIELTKLDWGKGFLSFRECIANDIETGECTEYGDIQTPGSVIESQLENTLGTGIRQLELADEINEIVGALVGQLARTVLTEGLSSFGGGGSSYGSLGSTETSPLAAWCAPDAITATIGENVRWTAMVFGGQRGTPSFLWSGDGSITGATTATVNVIYSEPGLKSASVRVTKGGQNVFQRCNNAVSVE